jgi:uncharacterized membrane protein AbrB (regulator of aidB expression)
MMPSTLQPANTLTCLMRSAGVVVLLVVLVVFLYGLWVYRYRRGLARDAVDAKLSIAPGAIIGT